MKGNKKKTCSICKGPVELEGNEFRPFCSARCKLLDLGNWATEKYRVAGQELGDEDGIEEQADADLEEDLDADLDLEDEFDEDDDEEAISETSEKKWRHDA